jgi:hypothetical protein
MSISARSRFALLAALVGCAGGITDVDGGYVYDGGPLVLRGDTGVSVVQGPIVLSDDGRFRAVSLGGAGLRLVTQTSSVGPTYHLEALTGHEPALIAIGQGGLPTLGVRVRTSSSGDRASLWGPGAAGEAWSVVDLPADISVDEEHCIPGAGPGALGCRASPERCVLDVEQPAQTGCGIPCGGDQECPSPTYCVHGVCGLVRCEEARPCQRGGETCAGSADLRVCFSRTSTCSGDMDCGASELCYRPAPTRPNGRCVPKAVGCPTGSIHCPERTSDAYVGFHLDAADPGWVWWYGTREFDEGSLLIPYEIHQTDGSGGIYWYTLRFTTPSLRWTADRWFILHSGNPGETASRSSILRWRAPRTGEYLLEVTQPRFQQSSEQWVYFVGLDGSVAPLALESVPSSLYEGRLKFRASPGNSIDFQCGGDYRFYQIEMNARVTFLGP